jgi:hypothetical protein
LNNTNLPTFGASKAREQLRESFNDWATNAPLTFEEALGNEKADINIFFTKKGDPGGTLAYGYMPTGRIVRFEAVEKWTDK